MSTTTRKTVAGAYAEIADLRSEMQAGFAAVLAAVNPEAKANTSAKKSTRKGAAKPKASESNEFVTWLHDTAEARATRKAFNGELSAWLRSKGLPTGGSVWAEAKAGERNVRTLKALAKKDAAARKA